jgi:Tol biopolymer transport system component
MYKNHFPGKLITITLLVLFLTACNGLGFARPTNTPTQIPPTPTYTPIPPTPAPSHTPTPSPKFEAPCFIAFTQITETGAEIFSADCSVQPPKLFQLTERSGAAFQPHISPDLRFIAYIYFDPQTELNNFWVIDNLNKAKSRPVSEEGIVISGDFSWSHDSQYIIYSGPQPDGSEKDIYRVDIDTGEIIDLTEKSHVWDASPKCSPTEDQIAFVSDRSYVTGKTLDNIWVMASDGTGPRNLTETNDWENILPGWSSNGEEIAFFRWSMFGDDERGPAGLWVVNLETGDERVLVEFDLGFIKPEPPVWSPDGKYIAYLKNLPPERDVYVYSIDSGISINVSRLPGDESAVSWSQDSQYLLFTYAPDDSAENWQLYTVKLDGTELEALFDFGGNGLGEWLPVTGSP